ncbi:hypothetical protein PR048_031391 [Dryococelus australis]|uniref:Uncharacterized protein n=1 Tax=Dryococelus australis TaxID=614101 RepID=A0ABQ9G559_9NEOP|nr:hypothetical protein PR048_031391 [Dryococelus australis]
MYPVETTGKQQLVEKQRGIGLHPMVLAFNLVHSKRKGFFIGLPPNRMPINFLVQSFSCGSLKAIEILYIKLDKMKLLESSRFEAINNALFIQTGDSKICGR